MQNVLKDNNAKKIKAILFDLDGVLVNMPDAHFEALNHALRLFGAEIGRDEHLTRLNGLPTAKKLEALESQGRIPRGLGQFINRVKQDHTKNLIPKFCTPDYSKILLLKRLQQQGYKLACCSNSIRETLHLMLRSADLFDFFDLIIGNDEVMHPKPDPEIYLTAFKNLGVTPDECIIVEDSPHGIAAAKASGATVYEVRGCQDVTSALFNDLLV